MINAKGGTGLATTVSKLQRGEALTGVVLVDPSRGGYEEREYRENLSLDLDKDRKITAHDFRKKVQFLQAEKGFRQAAQAWVST